VYSASNIARVKSRRFELAAQEVGMGRKKETQSFNNNILKMYVE
jgi:hypothetical protein